MLWSEENKKYLSLIREAPKINLLADIQCILYCLKNHAFYENNNQHNRIYLLIIILLLLCA